MAKQSKNLSKPKSASVETVVGDQTERIVEPILEKTPPSPVPKPASSRKKRLISTLKKRWWLIALGVILLAGGAWYAQSKAASSVPPTLISPTYQDVNVTLEAPCVVDAKQKARLRFLAGGKVTYIGAQEGGWVKKYQTIARIDPRTLQKQLEQELNLYSQERLSWDQTLDDTKDRALPKEEIRSVEGEQLSLNNKVLSVEIRDIAVRESAISSPLAGILTTLPTTVAGVQLSPTDYFEIVDPSSLICRAAIDEVDMAPIKLELPVNVTLDTYPDETISTNISFISPVSSRSESGTVFLVELPLANIQDLNKFRLGMNGDAEIILQSKDNILVVPVETTRVVDGQTVVSVQNSEGEIEDRAITTGIETDDLVEVLSGLSTDDLVILPE